MALGKQNINLNFSQGLDTKTDKNQVMAGKFLSLQNSVFDTGGLLKKRNGFKNLERLPDTTSTSLATLNGGLLAFGHNLQAYAPETDQWTNQGSMEPIRLETLAITRTSISQTSSDSQVSSSGLCCVVSQDSSGSYYSVVDAVTGQSYTKRTLIASNATQPRVALLNNYFVISYIQPVGPQYNLFILSVPISDPTSAIGPTVVSTQVSGATAAYDVATANNTLYYAWNASDLGGATRVATVNGSLQVSFSQVIAGHKSNLSSVAIDQSTSTPTVYVTMYDSTSHNAYTAIFDYALLPLQPSALSISGIILSELTTLADQAVLTLCYSVLNNYAYSGGVRTDYLQYSTFTYSGTTTTPVTIVRGLSLAAKAFQVNGITYLIGTYGQTYQPTYFIVNLDGLVVAKLAYQNGRGFLPTSILPSVNIFNDTINFSYLYAAAIVPVNKSLAANSSQAILQQYGINLGTVTFDNVAQTTGEIAKTLHISGGFMSMYDASNVVEHNFHVYPEDVVLTTTTGSGGLIAQEYFYQFTYEWTDAQGNIHRSAPSVPMSITTTTGSSTNTIQVATLRITQKTSVRIVGYRWSQAQQTFYQFTSPITPTINDPSVDYLTFTDANADSAILGNPILYTTGGVVENIAAPATSIMTLYKSRLFLVDSEDPNLIWYSKQVIEGVPVEMSDLFTLYVAPTQGAQGSTGKITALSAMDDKLIIFKRDAIYYLTGNGPDNSGAQNDFSDPVFITGTVGCVNPKSIVLTPKGLMFCSNKGIWLLGRDLGTQYIGAPVEQYNSSTAVSAVTVPGTNQVRFNMDTGELLMYDYYYDQWGTFTNCSAISSVIYQNLHTYLTSLNYVRQESPGLYLDGSVPVLLGFTTAWLKLTGLQNFQRAYYFFLLGNYESPHFLETSIAYDFNPGVQQTCRITPVNQVLTWGSDLSWGESTPWGGGGSVEQFRVFLTKQKCQAIQIVCQEVYDASYGVAAGAGLTLSGLNLVVSGKLSYPKPPASGSVG